ncbi:D-lactate dehydrogenase, partial [human gut metagenome]
AAKANGITVMRVPGYSPEAVAEHAMALAQAANRRICKAYIKVRNNNFALDGLLGQNFYGACAGIVGTGRIGAAMARICHGFGMNVLCYDMYKNPEVEKFARYVSLEELLQKADLVSLHCPLTEGTHHMINKDTIAMMQGFCHPGQHQPRRPDRHRRPDRSPARSQVRRRGPGCVRG